MELIRLMKLTRPTQHQYLHSNVGFCDIDKVNTAPFYAQVCQFCSTHLAVIVNILHVLSSVVCSVCVA